MTTLVYRYGASAPHIHFDLVEAQMRAAHDYANDLVAIERGRRAAIRAIDARSSDIAAAIEVVSAATRSTRKEALRSLAQARAKARSENVDELARIEERAASIRRDARALTTAYWGSYLTVEASADQQRKMPLYGDNGIEPNDPHFRRWEGEGQIGVQLQKGLAIAEAMAGLDTRVRIQMRDDRYGHIDLRVGSDGRAPIFARVDFKMHRRMPADARLRWVRLSRRREGRRWMWSVEITFDSETVDRQKFRDADAHLAGWLIVEPAWEIRYDGVICAARWRDHAGDAGEIAIPHRIVEGFARADRIRSVRDMLTNDLRETLPRALVEWTGPKPSLLLDAQRTIHLWKSPQRLHDLFERWTREIPAVAPAALALLAVWHKRDDHLWRYEAGARGGACRARREIYRVFAARSGERYRSVVVPHRDYRREARFGAEADVRHLAAPGELVACLDAVFLADAMDAPWAPRKGDDVDREDADPMDWIEVACERQRAGDLPLTARSKRTVANAQEKGGAWARRKSRKAEVETVESDAARKSTDNIAE